MDSFKKRMAAHSEHVKAVGIHCQTEETTKQATILPLLDILGFSPYDPTKVRAEHTADFPGVKTGERVDYALFCHGVPVMFIEAKAWEQKLSNHSPQLSRYFNATPEVAIAALTNGREWRFFTDLKEKNIMDDTPFLKIRIDSLEDLDTEQLYQFRHDQFQPEALRTLAEESVYLSSFTHAITTSLRDVDSDFVRYVANRSNVSRQLNQKFIESITPIVKQSVEKSVSAMVVSGLSSAKDATEATHAELPEEPLDDKAPVIDPENSKIVTTYDERMVFDNSRLILGSDADIVAKDTESYYSVLFAGKTTRWILRYYGKKQRPSIVLPIPLDERALDEINRAGLEVGPGNNILIDIPENLLRISGLLRDSYQYCSNDENFRMKKKEE